MSETPFTFKEYLESLSAHNGNLLDVVTNNLHNLAALSTGDKTTLFIRLRALGVDEDAIKELKAGMKQALAKKTNAQRKAPSGSPAQQSMSSSLLEALGAMGMTFKLNQLEDNIEVDGQRLDDVIAAGINLKLVDQGFSRPNIADGITVLAGRSTYHPVQDYLLGLKWDGHNHLRDLMDYFTGDGKTIQCGGKDEPLHAMLIGRWLTGAAARAIETASPTPFKHQTPMLVLIGGQGIGKSSWVRWLASGIGYEYHRESMVNPHGVEDVRSMVTKWIWEVSELASSLRRSDRDSLKAFITQEWHTYRKPWGKHQITKPTLCNFVGTLNPETGFLDDPTGNRRFLPVVIHALDHGYKDNIDVNQVWAQVVSMYRNGQTTPELNQAELVALAAVHKEHEIENPLETYINMYFDVVPSNQEMRCHTAAILQRLQDFKVGLPADPKVGGRKINDVLAPMGLKSDEFRIDGVKGRGWIGIAPNAKSVG
jgi:predicted P-loop ATPase